MNKKRKEAGHEHGGLHVLVYIGVSMWKENVIMTHWDSFNGTIHKDDEYSRYLTTWIDI